jgi:uncharacterized protein (TIGR02449 family)
MIMEDLLTRLEGQIKALIDQHNHLEQSNQRLSHVQGMLAREKELLLSKQQKAITQIQMLVSRLKTIEKSS